MTLLNDPVLRGACLLVLGALLTATAVSLVCVRCDPRRPLFRSMLLRCWGWWVMCAIFGGVAVAGRGATLMLLFVVAWLGLRELLAASPLQRTDHGAAAALAWLILPAEFVFLDANRPLLALAVATTGTALVGLRHRGLRSAALITLGIAAVPVILESLPAPAGLRLLVFLSVVVQCADCLQFIGGTVVGRTPLAPQISPNKTVEGLVTGLLGGAALGAVLAPLTPLPTAAAAALGLVLAAFGCGGDLTLSAIKRRAGIKDFSDLIPGHGGILDRVDSLTLAAPACLAATFAVQWVR